MDFAEGSIFFIFAQIGEILLYIVRFLFGVSELHWLEFFIYAVLSVKVAGTGNLFTLRRTSVHTEL